MCRFPESRSNLNYKCVIACFQNKDIIILRYPSSHYIEELESFERFNSLLLHMNGHADKFDPVLKTAKNI